MKKFTNIESYAEFLEEVYACPLSDYAYNDLSTFVNGAECIITDFEGEEADSMLEVGGAKYWMVERSEGMHFVQI